MKRCLVLLIVLLAPLTLRAEDGPSGKPPRGLLGCWSRSNAPRETLVRFEEARVTIFAGRLSVYRASYAEGKVDLRSKLRRTPVEFEIKGGELYLRIARETWRLARMEGVPEKLDLSPLPLGSKKIPGKKLKEVRKELERCGDLDQEMRKPFTTGGRPAPQGDRPRPARHLPPAPAADTRGEAPEVRGRRRGAGREMR